MPLYQAVGCASCAAAVSHVERHILTARGSMRRISRTFIFRHKWSNPPLYHSSFLFEWHDFRWLFSRSSTMAYYSSPRSVFWRKGPTAFLKLLSPSRIALDNKRWCFSLCSWTTVCSLPWRHRLTLCSCNRYKDAVVDIEVALSLCGAQTSLKILLSCLGMQFRSSVCSFPLVILVLLICPHFIISYTVVNPISYGFLYTDILSQFYWLFVKFSRLEGEGQNNTFATFFYEFKEKWCGGEHQTQYQFMSQKHTKTHTIRLTIKSSLIFKRLSDRVWTRKTNEYFAYFCCYW